jgi:hypothetical protein
MTTKFILAFAVAAFALTGGSLAVTDTAFAKDGKSSSGNPHTMNVSSNVHRDRDHGDVHRDLDHRDVHQHERDHEHDHDRIYVHKHDRDHSRHFWHGTWWNYGNGPCWLWSDDYDEYLWVCD